MPRVPSDPAQVIVNHASFRVQLGAGAIRSLGLEDTVRMPVVRRRTPVVWSGHSAPQLTRAVRQAGAPAAASGDAGAATRLLPRIGESTVLPPPVPVVVGPRGPYEEFGAGQGGTSAAGGGTDLAAYGEPTIVGPRISGGNGRYGGPVVPSAHDPYDTPGPVGYDDSGDAEDGLRGAAGSPRRGSSVKHAYYPHRRLNLGIVLLPLRVFLGFVSIYAGMGKLCDRVYFDGGKRGSMVTWLSSLHPWAVAEPLRDAALNHPVGAGLSVAFLQVVVGVLTIAGLWQRVAAAIGAALSIALLVTVSWRTVPVYDAPDFVYLAAWSPLVIAGAPVYSVDGHLAGDAWRRLGPRVSIWDLRRRVLRRGAVLAVFTVGATLLVGSVLGAAVRAGSSRPGAPGTSVTPTNNLPGQPLPEVSGGSDGTPGHGDRPAPTHSATATTAQPTHSATHRPTVSPRGTSGSGSSAPGTGFGTGTGGTPAQSGSAGGTSGGGQATTQAPPPPATQAPAPSQPSSKPEPGAIGGLLGSAAPAGRLLGLARPGSAKTPDGTA